MTFQSPLFLLLILLIPLWLFLNRKHVPPAIMHAQVHSIQALASPLLTVIMRVLPWLKWMGIVALIIALARPQLVNVSRHQERYGVDMIMALDTSASMSAEDFKPSNRFDVAKQTMRSFILKRSVDRIGLVVFGTDAYTLCPSTTDYSLLTMYLGRATLSMAGSQTAIGMAIAVAANRLKDSVSKSKVIILLTDGENNQTQIDPMTAARLAADSGIKIYTIGIGKKGGARIPIMHPVYGKVYQKDHLGNDVLTQLDEETLTEIASITDGQYFRAYDTKDLESIYNTIDQLEKTKLNPIYFTTVTDIFLPFIVLGFGLLVVELVMSMVVVGRLPS